MSGLLYGVGAVAVLLGVVMVGFGIPINEFSFGNTLIGAGTTAAVGGLIVIGLGVVVAQLRRLNEALATRAPIRASRPLDMFEPAAGARAAAAPGRVPFPPKPKSDAGLREPRLDASAAADRPDRDEYIAAQSFAPTLRNPDEPPVTVEDEVSLSPQQPVAASTRGAAVGAPSPSGPPLGVHGSEMSDEGHEPSLDAGWRSPPSPAYPAGPAQSRPVQTTYFDAMWPDESKPVKSPAGSATKSDLNFALPPRESAAAPSQHAEPEAAKPHPEIEPRAIAILKSGVVDGMGYTLYVDGSIEAELPQGTLRFASINELRSHLENNS